MWPRLLMKRKHSQSPYVDVECFNGKCIDESDTGRELMSLFVNKSVRDATYNYVGNVEDVLLLAKNLTPQFVVIATKRLGIWKFDRVYYPFDCIVEISADEVFISDFKIHVQSHPKFDPLNIECTSVDSHISLKQKLAEDERLFGNRWTKEYEDESFSEDPFKHGMFW